MSNIVLYRKMPFMKNLLPAAIVVILSIVCPASSLWAQAVDPAKTAKAAVQNDANYVSSAIEYNEDVIYLSQQAISKGIDSRVKELAQLMMEDHTTMLYGMEQLQTSGKGVNTQVQQQGKPRLAIEVNNQITHISGTDFDSIWTAGMLAVVQEKYDGLAAAEEEAWNPQLKAAIKSSAPLLRKHITQLKSTQKHLVRVATQKRKEEALKARK